MRVETLGFVVLEVKRAPFGLEIDHEEVPVRVVRHQVMKQTHLDILAGVSKRTRIAVTAFAHIFSKEMTKLSLVSV